MASTESSKAEEIILPEIRFLSPEELDSLRANAEALKKSSSKTRGRKRVDFPYSLERVRENNTVQTTVAKLESLSSYDDAKSGDQDAALRVIDQIFKCSEPFMFSVRYN